MTRLAAAGCSAALVLIGCVVAALLPADAQTTVASRCPSDVRIPPRGPTLQADVDGDRRADRVWLAGRRTGAIACQFTLVVSGAGGWSARRSVVPSDQAQWLPDLLVLATIDRTRGAEIVIERERGPGRGFALVLTLRNRRLVTLRAPDTPLNVGGLFSYYNGGGSIGGATQVDCPRPGTVVMSGWRHHPTTNDPYGEPRYYAERRTYRITGTSLRQVAAIVLPDVDRGQAEDILVAAGEWRPFPSCALRLKRQAAASLYDAVLQPELGGVGLARL